jgi:hypothetical protein
MKSKTLFTSSMMFLVPALAFGGTKNSANVNLDQPVEVAGTQLTPGQYKLIWEGAGQNVTVTFEEGKKTVATTSATLVSNRNDQEATETATKAGSTSVLQAVDLKNLTLKFENAAPNAGN